MPDTPSARTGGSSSTYLEVYGRFVLGTLVLIALGLLIRAYWQSSEVSESTDMEDVQKNEREAPLSVCNRWNSLYG